MDKKEPSFGVKFLNKILEEVQEVVKPIVGRKKAEK